MWCVELAWVEFVLLLVCVCFVVLSCVVLYCGVRVLHRVCLLGWGCSSVLWFVLYGSVLCLFVCALCSVCCVLSSLVVCVMV